MNSNNKKQSNKSFVPATKTSPFFTKHVGDMLKKGESPLEVAFTAQFLSALVGFDFETLEQVAGKLTEEVEEFQEEIVRTKGKADLKTVEELSDVVFSWVNVCRHIGVKPEKLAMATVAKYNARCAYIEKKLQETNRVWQDLDQNGIVELWREAKKLDIGKKEFEKFIT